MLPALVPPDGFKAHKCRLCIQPRHALDPGLDHRASRIERQRAIEIRRLHEAQIVAARLLGRPQSDFSVVGLQRRKVEAFARDDVLNQHRLDEGSVGCDLIRVKRFERLDEARGPVDHQCIWLHRLQGHEQRQSRRFRDRHHRRSPGDDPGGPARPAQCANLVRGPTPGFLVVGVQGFAAGLVHERWSRSAAPSDFRGLVRRMAWPKAGMANSSTLGDVPERSGEAPAETLETAC